jgi:hypothetical protein
MEARYILSTERDYVVHNQAVLMRKSIHRGNSSPVFWQDHAIVLPVVAFNRVTNTLSAVLRIPVFAPLLTVFGVRMPTSALPVLRCVTEGALTLNAAT